MKILVPATILPLIFLLASCGTFKKKEVGPFGDKRTRLEKLGDYEEEHYKRWYEKWMHRDRYRRGKEASYRKNNP